jgi:hypothetical protein
VLVEPEVVVLSCEDVVELEPVIVLWPLRSRSAVPAVSVAVEPVPVVCEPLVAVFGDVDGEVEELVCPVMPLRSAVIVEPEPLIVLEEAGIAHEASIKTPL